MYKLFTYSFKRYLILGIWFKRLTLTAPRFNRGCVRIINIILGILLLHIIPYIMRYNVITDNKIRISPFSDILRNFIYFHTIS